MAAKNSSMPARPRLPRSFLIPFRRWISSRTLRLSVERDSLRGSDDLVEEVSLRGSENLEWLRLSVEKDSLRGSEDLEWLRFLLFLSMRSFKQACIIASRKANVHFCSTLRAPSHVPSLSLTLGALCKMSKR